MPKEAIIVSTPDILGGTPCFRGTRIPAEAVFNHLKAGYSLQDALETWPTLDPTDLKEAVKQAGDLLIATSVQTAA